MLSRTVSLSWITKNNVPNRMVRITGFADTPIPFQSLGILECKVLFLDNPQNITGEVHPFLFPHLREIYVPFFQRPRRISFTHQKIISIPAKEYIDRFHAQG